jgi:Cu/Ag efflux protein CusF
MNPMLRRAALVAAMVWLTAAATTTAAQAGPANATVAEPAVLRPPFAKGTIEKIESGRRVLTLNTKHGAHVFTLTDRTYIYRGKEKLSREQLKPGDLIALNFFVNDQGENIVRRIKVSAPEPDGAPSEPSPSPAPPQETP